MCKRVVVEVQEIGEGEIRIEPGTIIIQRGKNGRDGTERIVKDVALVVNLGSGRVETLICLKQKTNYGFHDNWLSLETLKGGDEFYTYSVKV